MSTMEANIALISALPETEQEKIFLYLSENYFEDNPYRPMSRSEILAELSASRESYARGEFQDADEALDEIAKKYGL